MMDEVKNTALKNVFLSLRHNGLVTSQADFARQLKYNIVNVSGMIRGSKAIPYRFLKVVYKKFGININYIISDGKDGPIYLKDLSGAQTLNDPISDYSKKDSDLQKEVEQLKKIIQDKDKIIHLLEKQQPAG